MRFHRSVIWGAGILAILMLVVVGWRLVEEEMCLRRLDSIDEPEREAAARQLAKLKSSRAVPKLVTIALGDGGKEGRSYAGDALIAIGGASVPSLLDEVDGSGSPRERAARGLLEKLGRQAVEACLAGVRRHARNEVRLFSLHFLAPYVNEERGVYEALRSAFDDPDIGIRLASLRGLAQATCRAAEVLKLLTTVLEDVREEQVVRKWAAFDMPALGLPARAALREALKHGDPLVRVYAAHSLSLQYQWSDLEQETAPVLLEGLQAPDWRARHQAVDSLSRLDSQSNPKRLTAQVLKRLLEDPVDRVRSAAVTALGDHEPSVEMIAPLIRVLVEQPDEGPYVADVLARLGHRASPAVPALADWLSKEIDNPRRSSVARALGRVGPTAAPSVPALVAALKSGCCAALEALGRIGEGALEATPAIVEALSGSDCGPEARPALARIGPRAIPHLLEALRGSEGEVRRSIIEILGDFGPSARAAASNLADFVTDEEWETKVKAVRALGRVGAGAATNLDVVLRALSAALAERDWDLAAAAAEALGRIGGPAEMSIDRLVEAACSEGPEVRAHALLALGRLKRADPETTDLLRRALTDEEPLVRSFSALALRDLGIDDEHVTKALPAAFADDGIFRLVHALDGFPNETKQVLPWLVESLDVELPGYSIDVIRLIEGLGSHARVTLPALLNVAEKARAASAREVAISISFDPTVKDYSTEDLVDAIEDLRLRLEGQEGR